MNYTKATSLDCVGASEPLMLESLMVRSICTKIQIHKQERETVAQDHLDHDQINRHRRCSRRSNIRRSDHWG